MQVQAPMLNPVSRRIKELMEGHTDRREEAEIISLFRNADTATLNQSLTELELNPLFSDVDDRFFGPKNKTKLLNLLSKERLDDLEVPARAAVVDGLQRGWTGLAEEERVVEPKAGGIEERAIRNVFVGTGGPTLTLLKNAVNAGADVHDLHTLLHHDVDDPTLVTQMLGHFHTEARSVATEAVKPLSDIDDTFYSSLKDRRFPEKTVYPGVLAFYDELDRGPTEPDPLGDLTFLSARPGEVTGVVKNHTHRTLRDNGVKEASILLGSLTGLIGHEAMARKKMENFEQYTEIYPEYSFTWVGDSGQGDARLGQLMLEKYPDRVKGVFIHDVTGLSQEQRDEYRGQGIRIFDTYLGAAVEAHELGLISRAGLNRVAQAASSGFAAVVWDSEEQKAAASALLERDLERAREAATANVNSL